MASPRKGTKAVNCTTEKGQKYTNVHNYYLNDCSGVQIGNQNQQFAVFDDGVQLLEQPLEASTHGFTTDQVVVAMLNSILNPTHSADAPPVCLQKLDDSFNKLYGNVGRKRRFKEITGLNLLPFLRRIPDKFNLSLKNSNWFVQAVPLKVIQGPQQSRVSENEARIVQRSTKGIEEAATSVTSSDDTSEEETDGEWTIVGGKKGTKAKHVIDPASTKKNRKESGKKYICKCTLRSTQARKQENRKGFSEPNSSQM